MQLSKVNPTAPFVNVQPLAADARPLPAIELVGWNEHPDEPTALVSVRYFGTTADHDKRQLTVHNDHEFTNESWSRVRGSFEDAVRAARHLAVNEGFTDAPEQGVYGRSSVAVLDAGAGIWNLIPVKYTEGLGDGMDAVISMPIDAEVTASGSEVSVPYAAYGEDGFDKPDRVQVRFDDARVAALVGVSSIALAPGH